jgi:hypothetical protein
MVHLESDGSDTALLNKRLRFTVPVNGMDTIRMHRFDGTTGMQGVGQCMYQRL